MYLIEDVNGLQYKVKSLAEFCKEKEITLRLIRYTNPKWKDIEGKRYQEYHKGFKIISEDIEADEVKSSEVVNVIKTKIEDLNSFYKSDELIEEEDKAFLLESNQKLRKQLQYAKDQLRLLRAETRGENRLNSLVDGLFDKVMEIGVSFNEKYPHPTQELSKPTEVIEKAYIIQLSDLHFNKIVDLEHNKYNFEIASIRLNKLFTKHIDFIKINNIKNIVIACTGDFNNLNKLKEQYMTNEMASRIQSSIYGFEILSNNIDKLLELDVNISFVGIMGNESRIDFSERFGNVNSVSKDNLDYMFFQLLKLRYSDSCFFFNDCDEIETVFSLFKHNILLTHGDKLNHKNLNSEVESIQSKYVKNGKFMVDYVLLGHIHQFESSHNYCRSASLVGSDEYAYNQLGISNNDISQVGHFITEEEIRSFRICCK